MARPLLSRKKDLLYLVFFLIHIPVMFLVDLVPLYPSTLVPEFILDIRNFYITTYRDQFFINPTAWFKAYMVLELIYHLPVCLWIIPAIIKDDSRVPLHLLVYACETAITTFTCIIEVTTWTMLSNEEKIQLGYLYGPYFALAIFMGIDAFGRVNKVLTHGQFAPGSKKGQ